MSDRRDSEIYYFELGEGRWVGNLTFNILDRSRFMEARISLRDRALALLLHTMGRIPGEATMRAEILGAPDEGHGVARVEVSVYRLGLEVSRLRGHYALTEDGRGVRIHITQRYGPHGLPWEDKEATAEISARGTHARYDMPLMGEPFVGHYDVDDTGTRLKARYTSAWGEATETMFRVGAVKPTEPRARARWDALLDMARDLEDRSRSFDAKDDPRAVFCDVYGYFLRDLAYGVEQEGFEDPDWVVRLAKAFAQLYTAAMHEYGRGTAPKAWNDTTDLLRGARLTVLDELVVSMAVHIGHDLPRALVAVGLRTPDGRSRIGDFHRVNNLLERSVDPLQDRIAERYNPLAGLIDRLMGSLDEEVARAVIRHARSRAWYDAELLCHPATQTSTEREIDERISLLCRTLMGRSRRQTIPRRAARSVVRAFRRRPRHPAPADDAFGARPQVPADVPPWAVAALGAHTERARAGGRLEQETLHHHLHERPGRSFVNPRDARRLGAAVDGAAWWTLLADAARDRPDTRATLAGLAASLPEPQRAEALAALGVSREAADRAQDLQSALVRALRLGFDTTQSALGAAAAALEQAGLPMRAVIAILDDPDGGYDTERDVFTARAAALFDVALDEVRWILDPGRWDDAITQVEETHWLSKVGPEEGVFYERVNIFYPYLTHHPLVVENHLYGKVTHAPDASRVDFRLERSLDGTFELDEGFIAAWSVSPRHTLVALEKRIRVVRNPTLYALLRANPDGLSFMLAQWLQDAARNNRPRPQSS